MKVLIYQANNSKELQFTTPSHAQLNEWLKKEDGWTKVGTCKVIMTDHDTRSHDENKVSIGDVIKVKGSGEKNNWLVIKLDIAFAEKILYTSEEWTDLNLNLYSFINQLQTWHAIGATQLKMTVEQQGDDRDCHVVIIKILNPKL